LFFVAVGCLLCVRYALNVGAVVGCFYHNCWPVGIASCAIIVALDHGILLTRKELTNAAAKIDYICQLLMSLHAFLLASCQERISYGFKMEQVAVSK